MFSADAIPTRYISRDSLIREPPSKDNTLAEEQGEDTDWGLDEPQDPVNAMNSHSLANNDRYITLTTHIWYNSVYQVPQIGLVALDSDGRRLEIDDLMRAIHLTRIQREHDLNSSTRKDDDLLTEYPPMLLENHPHTGNLIIALHPCRTGEIMKPIKKDTYLESFINFMKQVLFF